ncbi:MAG: 30S ribosomal protein S9 [Candidatus Margulisiibacteriota bacterium]
MPKKSFYGTGRRKTSIAKVWVFEGSGNIIVNDMPLFDYIKNPLMVDYVNWPLLKLNVVNKYDVVVKALGGGLIGQAGAIRLGIARALDLMSPDFKLILKEDGLLTRDSRIKERKKYGRKKARKGFQFRKR